MMSRPRSSAGAVGPEGLTRAVDRQEEVHPMLISQAYSNPGLWRVGIKMQENESLNPAVPVPVGSKYSYIAAPRCPLGQLCEQALQSRPGFCEHLRRDPQRGVGQTIQCCSSFFVAEMLPRRGPQHNA